MEQRGVVAAETISVLLMKLFPIVLCLRHRAPPTVVGTRIHSEQLGRRLWISQTTGFSTFLDEHGAFSIPRKALGLRPNDQSCHHETWLHMNFVDWSNTWSNQAYHNGNIRLKERPAGTHKRHISEVTMSELSLCISPITNTMSTCKKKHDEYEADPRHELIIHQLGLSRSLRRVSTQSETSAPAVYHSAELLNIFHTLYQACAFLRWTDPICSVQTMNWRDGSRHQQLETCKHSTKSPNT